MKTWQRILIVVFLLAVGSALGLHVAYKRARQNAWNAQSSGNLHTIGLAWMMYADDWNDTFPDLTDIQSLSNAVGSYVARGNFFVHPKTGQPYQPNSSLTYQKRPATNGPPLAVVYEADPAQDGTRAVLFADAHVERVNAVRWQELKKTSNIP